MALRGRWIFWKGVLSVIEAAVDGCRDIIMEMKHKNARLVQICCTIESGFEITYSFEVKNELLNVRLNIEKHQEIESISDLFEPAFLYENEMKDLYGVMINNISLDFRGEFYKLPMPAPFSGTD